MSKEFNWNKFKNNEIAVHCKTEKEANDFIRKAYDNACKWCVDYFHTNYEHYKFETGYCYSHGFSYGFLTYDNMNYYIRNNYEILKWNDYMIDENNSEEYPLAIQDLINENNSEAIYEDNNGLRYRIKYGDLVTINIDLQWVRSQNTTRELLNMKFKKLEPIKKYIETMEAVKSISEGKPVWCLYYGNEILFNNPKTNKMRIDHLLNGQWFVKEI